MTTGPAEGVWWIVRFIMIGIILMGVTFTIGKFYSNQDVRTVEALTISNKIIDCISSRGVVDMSKIEKSELLKCINLNGNEIYVGVDAISLDSNLNRSTSLGIDLRPLCESMEKGIGTQLRCVKRTYYVLMGNEKGKVDVLVGIKKVGQNV